MDPVLLGNLRHGGVSSSAVHLFERFAVKRPVRARLVIECPVPPTLLKCGLVNHGSSRITEKVWSSDEILISIVSPGFTLFRTVVLWLSLRRTSAHL